MCRKPLVPVGNQMNGAVLFTGKFSEKKEYLQRYSSDETSDDFARGRQPKDISSNAYLSILVPRAPRFFFCFEHDPKILWVGYKEDTSGLRIHYGPQEKTNQQKTNKDKTIEERKTVK